jgi:predicted ATPase
MMDAVHRYEGTVSRLQGDGLMAIFGAPIGHEDHAVRACYAALAMQDAVHRYADELRREHGRGVEIRVGLNSGQVIVRPIADDLHMDYTAMGQTVHLAARIEQLARASTVCLTPATLALVEGYVQVRALGPAAVKGLVEPVEVYELLGAGDARTRLQAAARRGLTRFVGRQAEMSALHGALERAGGGHGQVAALVGEPGVGKSRLVWELTHSHRTEGWPVLESGSVSYGKATSYLPVIDLLNGYCRVESRDDERAIREKVTGKLLTLDRALEPSLPALLALLDVPPADAAWEAHDSAQRKRLTLDAVRRLLLRESQSQPLLLVFEDLHWIDAETQALLDSLVESLPTTRVLLLVNYRPEYAHAWGNRGYYVQVRVDPLPAASVEVLLEGLLGGDPTLGTLKTMLVERTEGNPVFLEESVRALVETGVLAGQRGAYRLPRPLADIRVPATVQAVLAARIDRRPPAERSLLHVAAVIGKDVPYALLRELAGPDEEALRRGLGGLQAAEFLYEASLFPELEYTFKHALTHEVAYGSLLQERRKALHGRVVEAIERLDADRLPEHAELLAHHALRGEVWDKAVAHARQAGARHLERSAYRAALAAFEQALAALERLPPSRAVIEQGIDLRFDLRNALLPLAGHDRCVTILQEAEHLAVELGDRRRLGWSFCAT